MKTELALKWGGWVSGWGRAGEKAGEEAQDTVQSASQPTSHQSTVHTALSVFAVICAVKTDKAGSSQSW